MGSSPSSLFLGRGPTPDAACAALEDQLKLHLHPSASVRLTSPREHVPVLSPRGVPRMALASVPGVGMELQVQFVREELADRVVEITAVVRVKRKRKGKGKGII
jgi:hypothetical protein